MNKELEIWYQDKRNKFLKKSFEYMETAELFKEHEKNIAELFVKMAMLSLDMAEAFEERRLYYGTQKISQKKTHQTPSPSFSPT